jgi:hypothetical protein
MARLEDVLGDVRAVEDCLGMVAREQQAVAPTEELEQLLAWRNGFYAYQRGLHVFGRCVEPRFHDLVSWNAATWIRDLGGLADGLFFFAEDSFGDQFAWDGGQVIRFLAETGEREVIAATIAEWLARVIEDPQQELGLGPLEDWTRLNGPLPQGRHLFPRTPLILGGSLSPEDVATIDPYEDMSFKASLVRQLADVADGQRVELIVKTPLKDEKPRG